MQSLQECVTEDLALKKSVFAEADRYVNQDVVMASSTANIFPTVLAENLQHKSRVIVAHPLNPPYFVPLIELVPSKWTDASAMERARSLFQNLSQAPIVLKKEIRGFVICRIQHAVTAECFKLLRDDVIEAKDLDQVMPQGLGLRYAFIGQLETNYLNANGLLPSRYNSDRRGSKVTCGPRRLSHGIKDFCERYSKDIYTLQESFGPPIALEGGLIDKVQQEMEKIIPLDKLEERRKWRDERLSALAKLKKQLE
ncbi:hypothetical protein CHS0354_022079 [Potamilus streckersoni]|uniref:Uncharacterized protein n=1 Tax=Potamilus streckersoni TaxID=2493646 RepID=A0AAE0W037_9BIVA|nr:hypothetical protein CHS0354_022079 [Potamilus streckersoni]